MDQIDVGLVLPQTDTTPRKPLLRTTPEWGVLAEDLGYESIWLSEGWGTEAFVGLSAIAARTESIRVGTSVVNVFSRSPAVLAMAGATLAEISGGRTMLGVGAGHPGMIENLHGRSYESPIKQTFETIDLIKTLVGGDGSEVEYHGDLFDVEGVRSFETDVPVYNAALGPTNRRITGKLCDGWLPYNIPYPVLDYAFQDVAAGAESVSRDPGKITVRPWIPAVVGDDPDEARNELRRNIASYIGEKEDDTYKNAVAELFPEKADQIARQWRQDEPEAAADAVTDEMVRSLGISGTPKSARERLKELSEDPLIDVPLITIPYSVDAEMVESTVKALSPERIE